MNSRTMLALPVMVDGKLRCRLPICDATALVLADALIEADGERRVLKLSEALIADPAMAVWAILSITIRPAANAATKPHALEKLAINDLAEMLAAELPRLLESVTRESIIEVSNERHQRVGELTAESVGIAFQVVRTDRFDELAIESAFLGALTRRWAEWLALAGDDQVAIRESAHWPITVDNVLLKTNAELDSRSRAKADEAWRRWLEEIHTARSLLPAIIEQQQRLHALKLQFDERLQVAKLDSLKEFAYGAGHELNNPLANIATRAQTLLHEESDPERRRRLAAINTQAFRAHEMLADMMLFARPPKLALRQVDLVSLIGELIAELNDAAAAQNTALHGPLRREPFGVEVDSVQIRVALKALCMNAIESLGSGGNVTIELEATDIGESATVDDAEEAVRITVTDDGPGLPAALRDKLFDPFFSGREANRGLGFGLCKCWRIVTAHGGQVEFTSDGGAGASFIITLPVGSVERSAALLR